MTPLGDLGWTFSGAFDRYLLVEAWRLPSSEREAAVPGEMALAEFDAWARAAASEHELFEIAERLGRAPGRWLDALAARTTVREEIRAAFRDGRLVAFRRPEATSGGARIAAEDGDRAQLDETRPSTEPREAKTWIEVRLLDDANEPVRGARYRIVLPNNETREGKTGADGTVRFDGIEPGSCEISFPDIDAAEWS